MAKEENKKLRDAVRFMVTVLLTTVFVLAIYFFFRQSDYTIIKVYKTPDKSFMIVEIKLESWANKLGIGEAAELTLAQKLDGGGDCPKK